MRCSALPSHRLPALLCNFRDFDFLCSAAHLERIPQPTVTAKRSDDGIRRPHLSWANRPHSTILRSGDACEFDGPHPSELRLRGATLTQFDGQNWMATPHIGNPGVRVYQTFQFPVPSATETSELRNFVVGRSARLVQYRIILEPLGGSNILFVVPTPRALFGNMRQVYASFDDSVESLDRDRMPSSYSGVSDISTPYPDDLKKMRGDIPPAMPERSWSCRQTSTRASPGLPSRPRAASARLRKSRLCGALSHHQLRLHTRAAQHAAR